MKHLMVFCLIFISVNISAQPGDIEGRRHAKFMNITEQLKNEPNNYELIWRRLEEFANPHFDLYSRGGNIKNENEPDTENFNRFLFYSKWTSEIILADINKLIDNKVEISERGETINTANFMFLRGKMFYLLGEKESALSDYLFALERFNQDISSNKSLSIKRDICRSIAAYYYNLDENFNELNLRQALRYIDLVSPIEFTENFTDLDFNTTSELISDPYERDKLKLLKYLNENKRLDKYYGKLIQRSYEIFKINKEDDDEYSKDKVEKEGYGYSTNESYKTTLSYVNDLAYLYFENKNYKKALWLTEKSIAYFPRNNGGYILARYYIGYYYELLNKIYQTKEFENFDKEMNSLIEWLGPTHGLNYNAEKMGQYIQNRFQKHPEEPRLYLALAIWHYKNQYKKPTATGEEMLDLLEIAEDIELKDYRLPFTKSLVYLNLVRDYELGLIEINKAMKLCNSSPRIHGTKRSLLGNLPNHNQRDMELSNNESQVNRKVMKFQNLTIFIEQINSH
jgi:hypothetical protein